MRRSRRVTVLLATSALVAGGLLTAGTAASASPARSARPAGPRPSIAHGLYQRVDRKGAASVLVLMRSRAGVRVPDTRANASNHAAAVRREQAPVLSLLSRSGAAREVHAYKTFDIVSAKVTKKGLDSLAGSPDVSQVVPNSEIKEQSSAPAAQPKAVGTPVNPPAGVCSTNPKKPQLNPQALETTETDSDVPGAKTARSLGATGAGVKVAIFPEGIDVNNPEFIRPDGSKVFTDYEDFTGDGTAAPTAGGEAFLDASSIAAQGNDTYNVQHYSDLPTAKPCYIKVEGVAPGASLLEMKIFNEAGYGFFSWELNAIDWAVNHDHANVLSESVGASPYPETAHDLIREADAAAVAAGVTVVVSSGDTGVTNELWSPSTSPGVISAAATTTYRIDLQDGYGGARFPGVKGYLNDNISSLSSGGETEAGRTVDMSAPGELNWTACTADPAQYSDCVNYAGNASSTMASGGTSESCPLISGGAALVIQAYRQTHGGANPTPALVERILVGTAKDVDAPADQQGGGELDTYRAVLAARSIHTSDGSGSPQGDAVVAGKGQINASGQPGTSSSHSFTVTNTGSSAQTVHLSTRTLSNYSAFHSTAVTLSSSSPTQVDWQGFADPYRKVTFDVTQPVDRLDASIAYHGASSALAARGRLTLVDPNGNLAGYSLPQGVGNYGDIQVAHPATGTWTAYIYSRPTSGGGSEGRYLFGWRTADYTTYGSLSQSTLSLAPGKSGTVSYTASTPSTPGDKAVSIVASSSDGASTIPVVLRSLVPLSTNGTAFQQLLTGGNGRASNTGEAFYYQVQVPSGTGQLNALVTLANNSNNPYYISLVSPHGDQLGYGSNLVQTSLSDQPQFVRQGVAHVTAPAAGTWDVIVNYAGFVSGDALSQPFSVLVNSKATPASAPGLPDSSSTTLAANHPTVVNVKVTNNSGAPQAYFVDPRRTQLATYSPVGYNATSTLPGINEPVWFVPDNTVSLTETLASTRSVEFDTSPFAGDPDVASNSSGTTAGATYTAPAVQPGYWDQAPAEVGPFNAVGAPQVTATSTMSVRTRAFDTQVTSSTGDLWPMATDANASGPTAVLVQPGASTTIPVTITPKGTAGTTVSGTLFVDDLQAQGNLGELPSADQAAALPYSYTIGS